MVVVHWRTCRLTSPGAIQIYRGAAHVVNMIAFAGPDADDPLKKDVKGAEKLSSGCWIYMEWLENGSLGLFLERVNKAKRSLPNRLMWRLFMCSKY